MPQTELTFIKGDKRSANTDYRDNLPVNMYAVARPILGADGYMIQAPGLTKVADGYGIDRGAHWNDKQSALFRVSGNRLVKMVDGAAVSVGTVAGSGTVSMDHSFNTQAVVADGRFYLYDETSGFREVNDADLGNPIDVVWVDGYYFFTDGEFIYHTDITNEASIDPLKFATAEFIPDFTYGVAKTDDNKVMVFGRYSIEYFINAATDNFAFQRVPSRSMKLGIVGTHCKTEVGNKTYVLGGRKEDAVSLHAIGVGSSTKLSTREVDKVIAQYTETELESAVLESFELDASTFVVVHLPNETLVFNETVAQLTGVDFAWSIYKSDVVGDTQWRAKHIEFDPFAGQWSVGDKQNANIGYIDNTVGTHYGELAEWLLYTPFVYLEDQSIDELDIEIVPGFSATDDATVFLSMSYNGVTFGREWVEAYSSPNDYNARFIVRRLGYVDNWTGFKLRGASRSRMAFSRGVLIHG